MPQHPGSMVIWLPTEVVEPEPLPNSFVRFIPLSLEDWGLSVPATTASIVHDLVAENRITHPYEPLPPGQILSAIRSDDRTPIAVRIQNSWRQQSTPCIIQSTPPAPMATGHTISGPSTNVSTPGRVIGAPHPIPNLSLSPHSPRASLQKFRVGPSAFPSTPARIITYTLLGIQQLQDDQSLALREIELADLRAMRNWPRNRRPLATWEISERERHLQVESIEIRRRIAERERRPKSWGVSGPDRWVGVSVQRPARLLSQRTRNSRPLSSPVNDCQKSNLRQRTPPMRDQSDAEGNVLRNNDRNRNPPPTARGELPWALREYDGPEVVPALAVDPPHGIPPASNGTTSSREESTQTSQPRPLILRGGPGVPGGRTWAAGWSRQPLYVMRCMIQYFFASTDRWARQPFYALRGVMRDYNYGSRATKAQLSVLWEYEVRRVEKAEAHMGQQLATIDGENVSEYYEVGEVLAGAAVSGKA